MDFPHGSLVTVRSTATDEDELGNSTATITAYTWGPCAVAPRYSRESASLDSPTVVVGSTIYGPATMTSDDDASVSAASIIGAADVLVVDGEEFEVDGLPEDYTGIGRHPFTGWEPGLAVPVRRVRGA